MRAKLTMMPQADNAMETNAVGSVLAWLVGSSLMASM